MELPIGIACNITPHTSDSGYASPSSSSTAADSAELTLMIDGRSNGNWTRFINHSCAPYSEFRMRRAGNTRIMAVEAVCDLPADVELTVSYRLDYYGPGTKKVCCCRREGVWGGGGGVRRMGSGGRRRDVLRSVGG
ncbi:hypothetical protein BKA56DRAFT_602304 [Ilyonectria sp. MPI-CAGE-AT-0026]|nr:hypothetical protein BKA56DRAFT_602304 [Ilyonectria sp. MPI-CAGE-AT-0026]